MNRNIYKGSNPIFESILKESGLHEQESKKSDPAINIISSLNTIFTMILDSSDEKNKTPEGFDSFLGNKIGSSKDLASLKNVIIPAAKSLSVSGGLDKKYSGESVKFIEANLSALDSVFKDSDSFQGIKPQIDEVVAVFRKDLQSRVNDLKKTKTSAMKESEILEQNRRTGEESNVQTGEFEGPAFDKSKEAIDAALGFTGEITRDKYTKLLSQDSQVQNFDKIANDLLKQAKDLQLVDRRSLKIVAADGTVYKRKDYKVKIDSLINEIIRQKKEYRRIKDLLLSSALGSSQIANQVPVGSTSSGGNQGSQQGGSQQGGSQQGGSQQGGSQQGGSKAAAACTFPVKIGSAKCEEVSKLQTKIMDLFPSISKFLESRGKADGKYGKGTSKCVNIILGYLNKNKDISLVGDLTKDGYDSIMALTENDIIRKTSTPRIDQPKESHGFEKYLKNKIFEAEFNEGVPVLGFDSFAKIIAILEDEDKNIGYKIPEECLDKSIDSNVIDPDCFSKETTGGKKEGDKKGDKPLIEWKGYKPVQNGAYTIYYDESWSEWWGDFAKGALISGLIIGAVAVTGGIAIGAYGAIGAGSLLGGAAGGVTGAAYAAASTTGAITIASGAIGGASIAKWAGSDRQPVTVIVYNGYIENLAVSGMAKGLSNSLEGTVSSPDLLAIMSTLILCRGTYTDNGEGKAVTVWSEVKKKFQAEFGSSIESAIQDVTGEGGVSGFFKDIATDMSDIPSLPRFKTKDPISGNTSDFDGALEACKLALPMLSRNEPKTIENIKDLKEKDLEDLSDAMEGITDEVSDKVEDSEDSEDSEK